MSQGDSNRPTPELTRLVDAWLSGDSTATETLSQQLRESRDAREYFLEMLRVEAALEWRFASQDKVANSLTEQADGTVYPVASIVVDQLGFRHDEGFATVLEGLSHQESLAQLWLRMYPVIRANVFLWVPQHFEADACVNEVCQQMLAEGLEAISADQLVRLVTRTTCDLVAQRLDGSAQVRETCSRLIELLLADVAQFEIVALYDAFGNVVPRRLPAEELRLLCQRYLLEKSPERIAKALRKPATSIQKQLANTRTQILTYCSGQAAAEQDANEAQFLSTLNVLLDRPANWGTNADATVSLSARAATLEKLFAWMKESDARRNDFLAVMLLHESLHRYLSLDHLLKELKWRKDAQFHRVVAEMVQELQDAAAPKTRPVELKGRSTKKSPSKSWMFAVAAALFLSATVGLWQAMQPEPEAVAQPDVANPIREVPCPAPAQPPPPAPVVIATFATVLDAKTDGATPLKVGHPLHLGDRIQLGEGVVRLVTPTENEWVLEGPVTAIFDEVDHVTLQQGKIVGFNHGQGTPLVVQTPEATIVDLGTEFGVSVTDDLRTAVAVYEGSVQVNVAADQQVADRAVVVEADHGMTLGGAEPDSYEPVRLAHGREFVRPDEVGLRIDEQNGSTEAARMVAFYELLRVDGLLAYQGFDSASQGEEFSLGFASPAVRPSNEPQFANKLAAAQDTLSSSNALLLQEGTSYFIDLDVSPDSVLARKGMLDASGKLSQQDGELWLSWQSQMNLPPGQDFDWMGLSLMSGDTRNKDEPLFVGQPNDLDNTFGIHLLGDDQKRTALDFDPAAPGIQARKADNRSYLWFLRIRYQDGQANVAVWCDVDVAELNNTSPHAQVQLASLAFDRFRVELSELASGGTFVLDRLMVASSLEALAEAQELQDLIPSP